VIDTVADSLGLRRAGAPDDLVLSWLRRWRYFGERALPPQVDPKAIVPTRIVY
jgi:hypothetical protein